MKLLLCVMLPSMAAGFTVMAPATSASRMMQLRMADVADEAQQRIEPTAREQKPKQQQQMTPFQRETVVPNFTGTEPLEQSLPTAGLPRDSYNKYGSLVEIDNKSYKRFGENAAPTFSATAPAGTPPEVDPAAYSGGHLKYKRLDEEDKARAVRSGFAKTKARAIFSATEINENSPSGYYKYRTLNQEDNERALRASYRPINSDTNKSNGYN